MKKEEFQTVELLKSSVFFAKERQKGFQKFLLPVRAIMPGIILFLIIGLVSQLSSQTLNTWQGSSSGGSWATTGNWSLGHVPTTSEAAVINNVTGTITAVPSNSIEQLLIDGTSNVILTGSVNSGNTLTITGGSGTDLEIQSTAALTLGAASSTANEVAIELSSGITGSVDGTLTINGVTSGTGSNGIRVDGNLTVNGTMIILQSSTGTSFVRIRTTGSATISSTGIINNSGEFSNGISGGGDASTVTISGTFNNSYSGNAGTYNVYSSAANGTQVYGTFNAYGTAVAGSGNFTIESGGTLITSNSTGVNGSLPNTTFTCQSGANYVFNASGTQSTGSKMTSPVNNITFSGSGAKTLSSATTVNGILTMAGTATTTSTPSYGSAATLEYAGTGTQTTGTEFPSTFSGSGGLIIANTSGNAVVLSAAKTITNSVSILSSAILNLPAGTTSSSATLSLGNVNQASGSWGSTSSTATHKNNTYFAATTGILNVSSGIGPLDHFVLNLNSPQSNGTAFTGTNNLTAKDANSSTITTFNASTDNVTISANTPLTGTISGLSGGNKLTSATDFSSGVANLTSLGMIYAGNSGTGTFTATSSVEGSTGTSGSVTINPGAANAAKSTLTPTSASITADGASTQVLTVQAKDASGNNLTTGGSTVLITKSSGTGTIGSVTDNSNGTYTATVTSPTTTGSGIFVATLGGSTVNSGTGSQTQSTITYIPGALDHFAISTITSPQTAGTAITGITLTAQDVNNNTVTSFTSTVVYSGTAGFTGTSASFTSGVLSGVSVTPTVAGSNLTFIVTGSGKTGTATITTINPGALDHFAISTITSPQTAGTAITGITLTAQDVNNNTVTSFVSTVAYSGTAGITGTSSSFTSGVLSGVSVTPTVAGSNLTFIVTGSGKTGTATITTINPGTLDHFAISTITSPQTAGTAITGITLTAKDVNNNTVTSFTSTVAYSGTAGITGTSGAFTSGVLSGVSVTPTVAGSNLTFIVTGSGKTGTATITTINPGALDHFAISTITSPQTSGTAITGITLTAQDVYNNTVTSFTTTVAYSGTAGITGTSASFTSGVLSGVSVTPTVAGSNLTFIVTGTSKTGTATITTINPGAANAAKSTLTPASASLTADGVSTQVLTVQAKDANGNNLTTGGSTVLITKSSGTGTIGSVTDNSNGTYTATVTAPTATGSGVFVATLGGSTVNNGTGSQTTSTITYIPGTLDHFAISTITSPQTAGTAITGITLTAQDVNNNTVTSFTGTVAYSGTAGITGTSASFTSGVLSSVSVTPTVAGSNLTFIVTGSGKTGTATITTINPGALDHFVISTITSPQTAGTAITGITLTAKDVNNNTVTNFTSTVAYSGTAGITGTSSSFTSGVLSGVSVTPTVAGSNLTFIVTNSGKTGTATITTINPGVALASQSTLTPTSASITANGTSTQVLTVQAKDTYGNNLTTGGSTVTITKSSGTGTIGSISYNGNGTYTAIVTSPTASGSGVFVATLGGSTVNSGTGSQTTSTITYTAGALYNFAITTISSPQTAGTSFSVTITAQDVNNNPVTSYTGTVNMTTNAGTITPSTSNSFVSGVLTQNFTVTQAGTLKTITATQTSGTATGTSNTFIVNNPVPSISNISPTNTCSGGSTFTLTVNGTNFNSSSIVLFAGASRTTTYISSTQLTASILSTDISSSGSDNITVQNPTPAGGTSSATTFTVNALPQGRLAGNTVCSGGIGQFTYTSTSGTGPFSLIISGTTYNGVVSGTAYNASPNPGSTTAYTLTSITDANGCMLTSGITGASATITVNPAPTITSQPVSSLPIAPGAGTATFTVGATGYGTLSYQWQVYITGSWGNVSGSVYSGATTSTLTITNPTYSMNGYAYRCIVSGGCSPTATSDGTSVLNVNNEYYSRTTANWAVNNTWSTASCGGAAASSYPQLSTDIVDICSGNTVTDPAGTSPTCGGLAVDGILTIGNNPTITVDNGSISGSGTINGPGSGGCNFVLYGNAWTFNGTFNGSTGFVSINVNGTTDQTMSGTLNFRNFNVAKTAGTTLFLTTTPTIGNTLTLTSGNFNFNGGAQTVLTATYPANLTLGGSGAKTIGTATNGTLANGIFNIDRTSGQTPTASVTNHNISVHKLQYSGVTQAAGTYGSTSSSATNKNNTFFTSGITGYLNVLTGAATKLVITGSSTQTAGTGQNLTITAEDASGNTDETYTGDMSLTFSGANSSTNPVTTPTITDKNGMAVNFGTATMITFTNGVATVSSGNNGVMTLYKAESATISATDGTISGTLAVTVSAAAASKLVFTSTAITTTTGVASSSITVQRQDAYGNPNTTDASRTVTLSSTSTGTVTFNPTSLTIASGSSSTTFTYKDTQVGTPTITAASTSPSTITSATQQETINLAASSKLAFNQQPSNTAAGSSISPSITVQIEDANNNLVTTDNSTQITLAIGTNPGSGTLSGTKTVTVSGGVATFSTLSINKTGTGYTLTATSSPSYTGATSNTFNITPGTATQLVYNQQPTSTTAGSTISPAITVQIEDANNNLVTTDNATQITMAIGTNPGSGALSGTAIVTASAGIATFSNLSINNAGSGYTLNANATVLTTATSNTFTINNPNPSISNISPNNTCAGGSAFILTVNGSNFNSTSVVLFAGASRTTTYVNATQITASFLSTDIATGGSFNITVQNPIPGGGTSSAVAFTVNALPTAYSITGGGTYCSGGSGVAVGLSGSQTGVNYQLQIAGINSGSAVAGNGSLLTFGNQTSGGACTVIATNTTTLCTNNMTGSISVTVNPLPTAVISGTTSICSGSSTNLSVALTGTEPWNITYSDGHQQNGVTSSPATYSVSPSLTTTYTVTAVNDANCTGTNLTGSAVVTVNSLPTAYSVTGGGSYCSGGTGVAVGLSNSQTGVNYQLQLGGISTGLPVAGTNGNAISFGNQTGAGTYIVVATNSSSLCTYNMSGSVIVSVNPIPAAYSVTGGGTYCSGGTGEAVGLNNSETGVNYQLQIGGVNTSTTISGTTGNAISFGNQTVAGTYTVEATNSSTTCSNNMSGNTTVSIRTCIAGLWDGTNSQDWSTGDNWDNGNVPTNTDDAIIPTSPTGGRFPVISDIGVCNNLTINAGASLVINSSASLNISGNLVLGSNSNGTGAVIQNGNLTVSGNTTVNLYLPVTSGNTDFYHYISAPTTNATLNNINNSIPLVNLHGQYYNPDNPPNASQIPNIWKFDETHTHNIPYDQNAWLAPTSLDNPMTQMTGFALVVPSTTTINFTGSGNVLNNGDYSLNITKSSVSTDTGHNTVPIDEYGKTDVSGTVEGTGPGNGFNLAGNPYPSPIDWNLIAPNLTSIDATAYFFMPTSAYVGIYGYYNGITHIGINATNYIPSMQAFILHTSTTESLQLNNTYRTVSTSAMNQHTYKLTDNADIPSIRLSIIRTKSQEPRTYTSDNEYKDETVISFIADATSQYDIKYDALKIMNSDALNIFSVLSGTKYAINTLSEITNGLIIPLSIKAVTSGQFTINAENISGLSSGTNVYLIDAGSNTTQKLTDKSDYTFTSNEIDINNRFYLKFVNSESSNQLSDELCYAYTSNNVLYLTYNNPLEENAIFSIYNIAGQVIRQNEKISNGAYHFNLDVAPGAYLVKVVTKNNVYVKKVYIQ